MINLLLVHAILWPSFSEKKNCRNNRGKTILRGWVGSPSPSPTPVYMIDIRRLYVGLAPVGNGTVEHAVHYLS